jgi:putative colanic acid biosynthesis UDP-glucose lipid carrier transferase
MIDPVSIPFKRVQEGGILNPVFPVQRLRQVVDRKKTFLLIKRGVDILFSLFFIVGVLSWLLPLLALLIKLYGGGPVFFLQKRVGRGGKIFTCYKLRTLPTASGNNPSITKITQLGRFLRSSNLDEFPQFFNVLKGDMSLVGPRPHMLSDCQYFAGIVAGYKFRNMVKPGLTGWAQVKGFHGPVRSPEDIRKRFEWDAAYIRQMSGWLDTFIFLRTIRQRVAGCFYALAGHSSPAFSKTQNIVQVDG